MKKELLTIALALTMGFSLTACKGAEKKETEKPESSEKTVETSEIDKEKKKTLIKTKKDETEDVEDTNDTEDTDVTETENTDDTTTDGDDSSSMMDGESNTADTSSTDTSAAYKAILDVAGYEGRPTAFKNKKALKNTSFAKYIDGGIQIVEVGSDKDQVYEIIDSAIYPLPGYTDEQKQAINLQYQSIPAQYAAYDWIEVTCSIEGDCEVIRFHYKDLDNIDHANALQFFGHSPYTDLSTTTTGYLAGGFTQK